MDTTKRIIIIVGLPASGKTTHASYLTSQFFGSVLIDDPKNWDDVLTHVLKGHDLIVLTDPHLCFACNRDVADRQFKDLGFNVDWVFFENNPDQCIRNSRKRGTKKVERDIMWFSKNYTIPHGAEYMPVYSPGIITN